MNAPLMHQPLPPVPEITSVPENLFIPHPEAKRGHVDSVLACLVRARATVTLLANAFDDDGTFSADTATLQNALWSIQGWLELSEASLMAGLWSQHPPVSLDEEVV